MENKRGQQAGLATGIIFGIASLVIAVIIGFLIVSTLTDAELLEGNRASTTITNETGAEMTVYINATGYTLAGASSVNVVPGSYAITGAFNGTEATAIVVAGNITVSDAGVVTNSSALAWGNATLSYTYSTKSSEEVSSDDLSLNFTKGVDNVSGKIPTVLLVAAIVIILGILALLVGVWQNMRMGGGQTL